MAWITLTVAGFAEIVWAVALKYSHGFSRLTPTIITACALLASIALLAVATRALPIGTAYAVWTGIGAVGTAITGMVLWREPASLIRLACIALIVVGVLGLKASHG